ncbi:CheR family methyltransferase [Liquorilactobacillus oeni]|uniref:protein-glutamate O-methyltransferase n=2 Tax=Liquorilactobacillus oeni TaxID=303241 RepID=A0A0R1MJN6_9LACO|nr:protein-glutamate O-methyltransferase CheR [Liquorilactobacillus oeni]AJA34184.1 chemotaxis protein methyltransferase CheR [Liquorilactobacillus oeni]KRL05490.1 protein-glutamate O-methyltransferase [Liquorilactobacillus oeni DSM 19972]
MGLNFAFFNDWVQENLGIELDAYKERQMQRRITNIMNRAGAKTLEQYASLLKEDRIARIAFIEHLTINVTNFYRNKEIFELFEQKMNAEIFSRFEFPKIWSAACSTGAEPYTLAMITAKKNCPGARIVATDIDEAILNKARAGRYSEYEVSNLAKADLQRFFNKTDTASFEIKNELKRRVTFKRHDLLKDMYEQNCHVVVCRNVTIYFKPKARDEVYRKLASALVPGGLLFTGATETINSAAQLGLKKLDSFIYQKKQQNERSEING